MSDDKRRMASYLLPDPGGEVVRGMRVAELEALVKRAYMEGYNAGCIDGRSDDDGSGDFSLEDQALEDQAWQDSFARAALEGKGDE